MTEGERSFPEENDRLSEAIARFVDGENSDADRQSILREFADVADELREFMRTHDQMRELANGLHNTSPYPHDLRADIDPTIDSHAAGGESETSDVRTMDTPPGTRLRYVGDYELIEELARGGMGVVYRARQVSLQRTVAVKMILSGQLATKEDIRRFRIEAEAAAELEHPNIVSVYEVGQHEGQHYFSMGFVDGTSLAAELTEGPLPARRAAEIVKEVAEAVHYAHQQRVIHRDLKPSNILLDRSRSPRVTDFGLAKRLHRDETMTSTGQVLGTPSYMPPEQATGATDRVRETADVYSLGAVLYATLTGRPPFQADNPIETMRQVLEQEPVAPRQLNPAVPRDLENICLKCLEKSRRRRYQSARELGADLDRFLQDKPVAARPIGTTSRLWRWCKRRPAIATLLALLLVSMLIGTIVSSQLAVLAEQRAKNAEEARDEADARAAAEAKARQEEQRQRLKAERMTTHVSLNRGLDLCQRGETHEGILWLARALELVPPQANDLEQTIRSNLGDWRQKCFPAQTITNVEGSFLRFTPNGEYALTTKESDEGDRSIQLWHTAAGKPLDKAITIRGEIKTIAFNNSADLAAFAVEPGNVVIWRVPLSEKLPVEFRHDASVVRLVFASDERLITIDEKQAVRIWDLNQGQQVGESWQHKDEITAIAGSDKASLVVSGDKKGNVQLRSLKSGMTVSATKKMTWPVSLLDFNDDGSRLAVQAGDGLHVWNVSDGSETVLIKNQRHRRWLTKIVLLTAGSKDARLRIWNANTGIQLGDPVRLPSRFAQVVTDTKRKLLLAGIRETSWTTKNSTVQLWSLPKREPISPRFPHGGLEAMMFADNPPRFATMSDGVLRSWAIEGGRNADQPMQFGDLASRHGWGTCVAFSPDGKQLLSGYTNGATRLWDTETGQLILDSMEHPGPYSEIRRAVFSPDGSIVATASHDATVKLWNAKTGELIGKPLNHLSGRRKDKMVWSAAFHPDGRILATGTGTVAVNSFKGGIRFWNVETGELLGEPIPLSGGVRGLAFSTDGKRLASAYLDGTAQIWDVETRQAIGGPMEHPADVRAVDVSPDGNLIVTGCEDGVARLWDARTQQATPIAFEHDQAISSVDLGAHGQLIATASHDGVARAWDAQTGRPVGGPRNHPAAVWWVELSPDGSRMATACIDGVARIWPIQAAVVESADQIILWAEVTTGMTLGDDGVARNLRAIAWQQKRKRLIPLQESLDSTKKKAQRIGEDGL